jgi:hypothetical protein
MAWPTGISGSSIVGFIEDASGVFQPSYWATPSADPVLLQVPVGVTLASGEIDHLSIDGALIAGNLLVPGWSYPVAWPNPSANAVLLPMPPVFASEVVGTNSVNQSSGWVVGVALEASPDFSCIGYHPIIWTMNDDRESGYAPRCGVKPPDCSGAVASPSALWPPNHELVPVAIAGVTDPAGEAISTAITGIFQDEPTNGPGSGHTPIDAFIAPDGSAQVRSERSGLGDGRVYHLSFSATNASGASCTGSVTVCVPHDPGRPCIDGGSLYDSTSPQ